MQYHLGISEFVLQSLLPTHASKSQIQTEFKLKLTYDGTCYPLIRSLHILARYKEHQKGTYMLVLASTIFCDLEETSFVLLLTCVYNNTSPTHLT